MSSAVSGLRIGVVGATGQVGNREFAEEGLLIGKKENPIKLRLINDALVITDGGKIVARFAFNQTETPNLKVPGVFDFANHTATKGAEGTKQTIIRYSGG